jgi:hypothetical protein
LSDPYNGLSKSAHCASQTAHGLARNVHAVTLENLLLLVQRQMIRGLRHDHLRQQAGSGRALFDWLRRLGRRLHRESAHRPGFMPRFPKSKLKTWLALSNLASERYAVAVWMPIDAATLRTSSLGGFRHPKTGCNIYGALRWKSILPQQPGPVLCSLQ